MNLDAKIRKTVASFATHLGIIVSKRCNLMCPSCITRSSPSESHAPPRYDVHRAISEAAALRGEGLGPSTVSFTGGEPFLLLEELESYTRHAHAAGLKTGVVTNAFWAENAGAARRALGRLRHVTRFDLSTDPRHERVVSLDTLGTAIRLLTSTRQLGSIRVVRQPGDDEFLRRLKSVLADRGVGYKLRESSMIWLDRNGVPRISARQGSASPPLGPCAAMSPVIDPSGTVFACCGALQNLTPPHPLVLGDLRSERIRSIYYRYHTSPFVQGMRIGGIAEVLALLSRRRPALPLPVHHDASNMCYTCFHVFARLPAAVARDIARSRALVMRFAMMRFVLYGEGIGLDVLPATYLKHAKRALAGE